MRAARCGADPTRTSAASAIRPFAHAEAIYGKSSLRTGNQCARSENQMGLAVRSLRRPCSTPAEHACVWRRSDCATSGPQEQSSEHGWSLARRRVRYVAVGGSARGRGSRPAADLCLRRG
eukprot:scaffold32829_cov70-Phaeocystis_antarctica.AAC.2